MEKTRIKEIREAALQVKGGLEAVEMPTRDGKRLREILSNLIQIVLELTEPTDSTDEINKLREERDGLKKECYLVVQEARQINEENERLKNEITKLKA